MESEKNMNPGNTRPALRPGTEAERHLMEGGPCGLMRCTCEEFPRVLYANEQMFRFLGLTEDSEDWRGFMQSNIFFMVPFEERRILRACLAAARTASAPVAVEHSVHSRERGHTRLVGWVRLAEGRGGKQEYHFFYMEVPELRFSLQLRKERAYQQVLRGVYDVIFLFDLTENTVECLHKVEAVQFPYILHTRIVLSAFFRQSIYTKIPEKDREKAAAFFGRLTGEAERETDAPMQESFRLQMDDGERKWHFVASGLDGSSVLLCGRDITEIAQPEKTALPETAGGARDNSGRPRVTIRTFGYFDVFVDGEPVIFRHEKSKEMLAILVDRKGGFVANPYLIACLWENEEYGEKIQNRCRQIAYRMMETLRQYGIEHIVEKVSGRRRIIPELVECDYYAHLQDRQGKEHSFKGAYMSDYSWGEATLSTLTIGRNAAE